MSNEIVPSQGEGQALYRTATDAATLCKKIVTAKAQRIGNRQYVGVEGWQAIAVAHGCAASSINVERVEGGFRATGQVRRLSDGAIIAEAEGFVGEDELTWFGGTAKRWRWGKKKGEKIWFEEIMPKRADYAIRAMAQTRAIRRACRSAFAHVVVMMDAGLQTTPAEEVPEGGFDHDEADVAVQEETIVESGEVTAQKELTKTAEEYVAEIALCDTSEKLEPVVKRYAATMAKLVVQLPKWHA